MIFITSPFSALLSFFTSSLSCSLPLLLLSHSLLLSLRFLLWSFLSVFGVVAAAVAASAAALLPLVAAAVAVAGCCVVAAGAVSGKFFVISSFTQAIAELSGAIFCAARCVHVSWPSR